ncbi:MAG: glutamate racemase [Erysipelotrichaceae bacterium]|jgi:glutamate racemase
MESKNKPIGIFDSGVGGLTVINHLLEVLPNENFIFFADSANIPYGNKDKKQLKKLVTDDIKFLSGFNIKAIIVACNTADSVINQEIKKHSKVDIIRPIKSTAKLAVRQTKNKKIGVLATRATCLSNDYLNEIKKHDETVEVYQQPCPLLASYIENQDYFNNREIMTDLIKQYLISLLEKEVDTIILGCTHYPLALEYLKPLAENVNFVSSSLAAVLETEKLLTDKDMLADKVHTRIFYTNADVEEFKQKTELFITADIEKIIRKAE